jgi:nicotinate-nucleotide adenylyltransferase
MGEKTAASRGERIGIFGGTFDPIHVGHLVTAVNVRHDLDLDRVLLVVANDPWQKADLPVTPAPDRLAMVEAAVADVDGLEASDLEIAWGGVSYTADTLAAMRRLYPGAELYVILGSDAAALLPTWERVEEVRATATLVVVTRPGAGALAPPVGWDHRAVEVPRLEVSSTDLRARFVDGRPLDWLVTVPVVHVIRQRGLYAVDQMRSRSSLGSARS